MSLTVFRQLALDITKEYAEHSGKTNKISNEEVRKLIAQSGIVGEINKILLGAGVAIDKIFISELINYSQENGNVTVNDPAGDSGQKMIIDGLVVFSLSPMK